MNYLIGGMLMKKVLALFLTLMLLLSIFAAVPFDVSAADEGVISGTSGDWKVEQQVIPKLVMAILLGDADGDGEVTILDATAIQRYLVLIPTHEGVGEKKTA